MIKVSIFNLHCSHKVEVNLKLDIDNKSDSYFIVSKSLLISSPILVSQNSPISCGKTWECIDCRLDVTMATVSQPYAVLTDNNSKRQKSETDLK